MRAKGITAPQTIEVEPGVGARATGRWREIRDGDARVLMVELAVATGGRYGIYADLCDKDDDEVGYVRREVELDAGIVEVALTMRFIDNDCAICEPCGLRIVRRL